MTRERNGTQRRFAGGRGGLPPEDVQLRRQMVAEHLAAHPEDRARLQAAWAQGERQIAQQRAASRRQR
jgi:hypothetical protein